MIVLPKMCAGVAGGLSGIAMGGAYHGTGTAKTQQEKTPASNIGENVGTRDIGGIVIDEGMPSATMGEKADPLSAGVRYSISYTKENNPVLVVNDDIVRNAANNKDLVTAVKKSISRFKKVPIKGQSIFFTKDTKDEFTGSKYTQKLKKKDRQTYKDKMRIAAHPQDIVYATTDYVNEAPKHARKDDIIDFARGELLLDVAGRKYTAETVIGFTKKGICELHDIVGMTPTQFEYRKRTAPNAMGTQSEPGRSGATLNDSIFDSDQKSNDNYNQKRQDDFEQSGQEDYNEEMLRKFQEAGIDVGDAGKKSTLQKAGVHRCSEKALAVRRHRRCWNGMRAVENPLRRCRTWDGREHTGGMPRR